MPALVSFTIPVDGIFSFEECLWYLDRGYDDCLYVVRNNTLLRALPFGKETLLLRIQGFPAGLRVTVCSGRASEEAIQFAGQYIRDWFDLDRSLQPFYRLLHAHPALAYMPAAFRGLRLTGIPDLFEALSWSIIGQQINLSFAYRLKRKLTEHFGSKATWGADTCWMFPEPEVLASAPAGILREMQFSQRKAEYLIGLAAAFAEGRLSRPLIEGLPDLESRQQVLTAIRGVGIWTANYTLMKSLRNMDAVPYGDAGLLQALIRHRLISDRKDQAGMDRLFRRFRGWESYLVFYLWRSLSVKE